MNIYLNSETLDLLMPLCRKRKLNPRELLIDLIKTESMRDEERGQYDTNN